MSFPLPKDYKERLARMCTTTQLLLDNDLQVMIDELQTQYDEMTAAQQESKKGEALQELLAQLEGAGDDISDALHQLEEATK